jgi:hypothetical protein
MDRDDMTALVMLIGLICMAAGTYLLWGPAALLIFAGAVLVYGARRVA